DEARHGGARGEELLELAPAQPRIEPVQELEVAGGVGSRGVVISLGPAQPPPDVRREEAIEALLEAVDGGLGARDGRGLAGEDRRLAVADRVALGLELLLTLEDGELEGGDHLLALPDIAGL